MNGNGEDRSAEPTASDSGPPAVNGEAASGETAVEAADVPEFLRRATP